TWPRLIVPAAAGVAVVAALILAPRWTAPPRTAAQFVANVDTFEALDDPSLDLVVDLTPDLNWETAGEAGLTAHGSAEHAVTHLTDGELRELGRLLKEEMARASN
ncbi:MAG: hypothetical protein HY047_19285, partial [Acidobacteria bacterium]|nr:hypothetical protein [Acidobacteriota bacterium]